MRKHEHTRMRTIQTPSYALSQGEQFHQGVSNDETLRVATHGFGIYRWWPSKYR